MRDLIPGVCVCGGGGSGHLPCKSGYGRVKRVQFLESVCDWGVFHCTNFEKGLK